ncbi:MAG: 2-amino-4-hydroxy-6-hydroxymethyldihydropteridine diphosphokinase [Planctomycetota bacterium]
MHPISQCVISFGSNLGDRRELVSEAAREISKRIDLLDESGLQTSRLFETPPIGGPGGQEPFLNAVGVFQTTAPARKILEALQEIENYLGRQRRMRWDARSIDLDVVLHGNLVGGATGLVVPHPRYTARQFVLRPACDVASDLRDPRFGWTLGELSTFLSADVPSLALVAGRSEIREELCYRLQSEHGIRFVTESDQQAAGDCSESFEADSTPWIAAAFDRRKLRQRFDERAKFPARFKGCPRLLVRVQQTKLSAWPAPHQMWPGGWDWPEYRLEIDEMNWAVSELASALQSMQCEALPVSNDGHWW